VAVVKTLALPRLPDFGRDGAGAADLVLVIERLTLWFTTA